MKNDDIWNKQQKLYRARQEWMSTHTYYAFRILTDAEEALQRAKLRRKNRNKKARKERKE